MPLDPSQNQKLDELITDLKSKEQVLADDSDANDAAQSSAQAAVAIAAGTQQAKVRSVSRSTPW